MPPAALRPALTRSTDKSRAWQQAQQERTGFGASSELGELGHVLVAMLRGRGYRLNEARWAAHAAAVPTAFNWQGNPRLAAILTVSTRTAQRARARLEADGLIRSYLLSPGDQLEGQRAPVRRYQVVRDVERLQRAGRRRLEWLRSGGRVAGSPDTSAKSRPLDRGRRRGVGENKPISSTPAHVPPTAAELREIAARCAPELASVIGEIAGAAERRETAASGQPSREHAPAPPGCPPTFDPAELDELDRELSASAQRGGQAPPRGS